MLLCCEPPMNGREPTGVSITAAIHHPAETTIDASAMSSTSRASGLLNRNMSAATGVTAMASPAMNPAAAESLRRTAVYTTPTVATPISAWGTRMLQELSPNTRTERPMIQSDAGGLSTVIELAASNEPKNHAFQLC